MPVAALYDIHGNLPALEAVLAEIEQAGADRVVVGGDVVAGPMPGAVLARLQAYPLPVQFIQGNADREVVARAAGAEIGPVPAHVRQVVDWVAQELLPQEVAVIAGWPATLRLEIPGLGQVLFCHATPYNDTDVFTRLTPEARLLPLFDGVQAPLVICGHTHMQFDRTVGHTRIVNAGSVGMPYGEPGAYWLLLGPEVQFRHTAYDREQAAARVGQTDYPHAQEFAEKNILHPPSEAAALDVFSPME